jgi:hypothetical protein
MAMPKPTPGPSASGSVVLNLGPGTGALVLHAPQQLDGAEIEISLAGAASAHRTHSQVRQRLTKGGTQYAAVYPDLAVGDYTIWRDAGTPAFTITVHSGRVTTAWWPES